MKVEVDKMYHAYSKAWRALEAKLKTESSLEVHNKFPREYNVKLHYSGGLGMLTHVEFPSDADFTWFILKWS
jgi:hypothetical protein